MAGKASLQFNEGAQPRVLVCDDNAVNCAVVRSVLERDNVKVIVVNSGEDALDEIRRHRFDLVLLDLEMPGMSGFDVMRQLRGRQTDLSFLPIVLLTAKTDSDSRIAGLDAGATDFLTKPFDPAELTARIRNHIGAKRLYDKLMVTNALLEEERGKIFQAQLNLLPTSMPDIPGLRFGAGYLPSSLASGDYYDVLSQKDGTLLIAIGDVSGHGIAAAMHMSVLRAVLHEKASHAAPLPEILETLNDTLSHSLDDYSFVTFYLAEFHPATGLVRHASAGHHPPLLQDLATGQVTVAPLKFGFPLGVEDEVNAMVTEFTLLPGQRMVVYTDGLVEQCGPQGSFFEMSGVEASLIGSLGQEPQGVVEALLRDHAAFCTSAQPSDDVTILIMDVLPKNG